MLRIPIEQLSEQPKCVAYDLHPSQLDLADASFEFVGRVQGEVDYRMAGHDVVSHGALEFEVTTACVRCLAPVRILLRAPIDELWLHHDPRMETLREAEEEDIIAQRYEGDFVEVADTLRELIMAQLPAYPHCSEDCRGLCPGCGADLNREPCRCSAEAREKLEKPVEKQTDDAWKKRLRELKNVI